MNNILELKNIFAGYHKRLILHDISLNIEKNKISLLIGPNGAGKSTLLKVIAGLIKPWKGKLIFYGEVLNGISASKRARMGIGYFMQGGEVFTNLTIKENLEIAGMGISKQKIEHNMNIAFTIFPALKNMENKRAGLLSGGEKQQLALAMVLIREPKLILLDEPSAGLSPILVKDTLRKIVDMKNLLKTTILLVEQNIGEGLKIADTVFLMKAGHILGEVKPERVTEGNLLNNLFFE